MADRIPSRPQISLTYRSGERVEAGDVVLEPVNGGERFGVVVDILIPNSEKATRWFGLPSGGVLIKWDGLGEMPMGVDVLQGPDYVFLVRRKGETQKADPAYRGGKPVQPGDIVRPDHDKTMGVVVEVIFPYSAKAIWYGMRSGGVIVKWEGWTADVSIGPDVFREEVCFVQRKDE